VGREGRQVGRDGRGAFDQSVFPTNPTFLTNPTRPTDPRPLRVPERRTQLVRRYGGGTELADDDAGGVVGEHCRLGQ